MYAYNLPADDTKNKGQELETWLRKKICRRMFFLANYQDRIENLSKACEYSESDSTLGSNFCLDYAEALEEDQKKSTKAQIQDAFDKGLYSWLSLRVL